MGNRAVFLLLLPLWAGILVTAVPAQQPGSGFSPDELSFIQKMKDQGGIRAGIRGYEEGQPGVGKDTGTTFHKALFQAFAGWLGVKASVITTNVAEIFGDGQKIPKDLFDNPNVKYDPRIFSKAEITLGSLAILPWRHRIMTLVPVVPNNVVLVTRKDPAIRSLADMEGRRVAVQTGSSFEELWKSIRAEKKIHFKEIPVSLDASALEVLDKGEADGVLADSFEVFSTIKAFPGLKIVEPVSDLHYLAWGIKKGNGVLEGLLTRFFRESSQDGTFDRLVRASLKSSLQDYLDVIGFRPGEQIYNLLLTVEERNYLEELRARGVLKIATMIGEISYNPLPNGQIRGFDYHLAKALSQVLGVRLEVTGMTDPSAFFSRNGVFSKNVIDDPAVQYEPDLFGKVDLYATPFALLPWRQKLSLMVPILPYGNIIVGKSAAKVNQFSDLDGKRITVLAGSYQEQMVKDLMAREKFKAQLVTYGNSESPLDVILQGRADLTIDGVQFFAAGMKRLKESRLTVSPLKVEGGTVAWAVSKSNPLLASVIKKYVIFSQSDGSFGDMFQAENGVDFSFYLELIGS